VTPRDERRLPRLQALKAEPPGGGDRRLWASLRFVEPLPVKKKRIWRLMRAPQLLVRPHRQLNATRTPTRTTPTPTTPHAWWGIEMTTGMVAVGNLIT
jgi:hypothetical protein